MTTDPEKTQRFLEGMGANLMLGRLTAALADNRQMYLERELESGAIRIVLIPPLKEVVREVSFMERLNMTEFARQAVIERVKRVLNERVAAMEADDAPLKMSLESEDADVLAVKVA